MGVSANLFGGKWNYCRCKCGGRWERSGRSIWKRIYHTLAHASGSVWGSSKKSIHTSCTIYPELSGFTDRLASSDCELLWTECEGDWFQVHQHVVCPGGGEHQGYISENTLAHLFTYHGPFLSLYCQWLTLRKARERDRRNKIKISHFFPEEQINFRRLGRDIFRH